MNLHLNEIEEYASLLMLPNEIADIIEVNRQEFINELNYANSEIKRAFYKGFLKTEIDAKKKLLKGENFYGENYAFDIDEINVTSAKLKEFKAKLIIQLYA